MRKRTFSDREKNEEIEATENLGKEDKKEEVDIHNKHNFWQSFKPSQPNGFKFSPHSSAMEIDNSASFDTVEIGRDESEIIEEPDQKRRRHF